jgi:protein phosphatase
MARYNAYGLSDLGRRRTTNQDTILVDTDHGVFIQADGMGGHRGGGEASGMAARIVAAILSGQTVDPDLPETDVASLADIPSGKARAIRRAILAADNAVTSQGGGDDESLAGMGSTIDVLTFDGDTALIGHVGDSRAYRFRDGALEQLTDDHSVMNELKRRFNLSEDEVAGYPYKNRVTHALGHLPDRRVDIVTTKTLAGDLFLLCSDGLSGVIDDATVADAITDHRDDLAACATELVRLANDSGGPDNISVVLVELLAG